MYSASHDVYQLMTTPDNKLMVYNTGLAATDLSCLLKLQIRLETVSAAIDCGSYF